MPGVLCFTGRRYQFIPGAVDVGIVSDHALKESSGEFLGVMQVSTPASHICSLETVQCLISRPIYMEHQPDVFVYEVGGVRQWWHD